MTRIYAIVMIAALARMAAPGAVHVGRQVVEGFSLFAGAFTCSFDAPENAATACIANVLEEKGY